MFWLYQAASAIRVLEFLAYLVDRPNDSYYVVVALSKAFMDNYEAAWRHLAKDGVVWLRIFNKAEIKEPTGQIWYGTRSVAPPQTIS
jgi:hypothetical protein